MFKPLSTAYSTELSEFLHRSYGVLPVAKGDFFPLVWRAWSAAFKKETIIKSFQATGIYPPNPDVILRRFHKEALSSDKSSTSVLSGDGWLKMETIIRREVKDQGSKAVKKLLRSLHHILAQNSILRGEIQGLKDALLVKKRREKKSYTLQLKNSQEYHGGAVFWSPKKVRQAQDDELVRRQEQQQLRFQKAERSYMKEQARLLKLQETEELRVERERDLRR